MKTLAHVDPTALDDEDLTVVVGGIGNHLPGYGPFYGPFPQRPPVGDVPPVVPPGGSIQ